jgi:hypothetical protein
MAVLLFLAQPSFELLGKIVLQEMSQAIAQGVGLGYRDPVLRKAQSLGVPDLKAYANR